jgi:hypothetical protein
MHLRYSLMIIFMLAFISPSFASYWIVRGSDNKCLVIDLEPTDKTITKVGKDIYSSRRRGRPTSRGSVETKSRGSVETK